MDMSYTQNVPNHYIATDNQDIPSPETGRFEGIAKDRQRMDSENDGLESHSGNEILESSYVKELQRNIRNLTKKISAIHKVESVVADNPSLTLDELVNAKKINNDQKAQVLKKPLLQQSLQQSEEHVMQYRKLEVQLQRNMALERQHLVSLHQAQMAELKNSLNAHASVKAQTEVRRQLLILSKFLRAAAGRRALDSDNQGLTEESKAFEGALLLLYGGDLMAVDAAEKLINGSSDCVISTEGEQLSITYGRVKDLSLNGHLPTTDESSLECTAQGFSGKDAEIINQANSGESDLTHANANLIELQDQHTSPDIVQELDTTQLPLQATIDHGSANIAALRNWTSPTIQHSDPLTDSWVAVPRDPPETGGSLNVAALNSTQNWADDSVESAEKIGTGVVANDGFHEVHHGRENRVRDGRNVERGSSRGRGGFKRGESYSNRGRSNFRGDGPRGRGGGRARGRAA